MTRNEAENSMAEEGFYIVNPNPKRFAQSQRRVGISGVYVSDSVPLIGKEEIARMLSRLHIHGT
ncbi:MAG: hypothetical protein ABSG74_01255 [Candidatus Bathyarchaeia archaeon]|jgi:hypothetical protein